MSHQLVNHPLVNTRRGEVRRTRVAESLAAVKGVLFHIFGRTNRSLIASDYMNSARDDELMVYGTHSDPTVQAPAGWEHFPPDFVKQTFYQAFLKAFLATYIGHTSGDILEFGTYKGYTARILAELLRDLNIQNTSLRLYDSFEGLPEITSDVDKTSHEVAVDQAWFKGQMALESGIEDAIKYHLSHIIPDQRLTVTKGFFENSLPGCLTGLKARIVHIDCDLYASTVVVLEQLLHQNVLQDGTVLLFDDFSCSHASPYHGQRRALEVVFERQNRFFYSSYFNYAGGSWAFFCHERKDQQRTW